MQGKEVSVKCRHGREFNCQNYNFSECKSSTLKMGQHVTKYSVCFFKTTSFVSRVKFSYLVASVLFQLYSIIFILLLLFIGQWIVKKPCHARV